MISRPIKPEGAESQSSIAITGAGSAWAMMGLAHSRETGGQDFGGARGSPASRKSLLFRFPATPNTIAEFPGDSHSGILIKEIKCPESRREGRFPGMKISALRAPRTREQEAALIPFRALRTGHLGSRVLNKPAQSHERDEIQRVAPRGVGSEIDLSHRASVAVFEVSVATEAVDPTVAVVVKPPEKRSE
jgi:hypothetical protein